MTPANRTKLNTDTIYLALLSLGLIFVSLKLLVDDNKVIDDVDYVKVFEHKTYLVGSIGLLFYVLARPILYFDDTNLYIKRIYKKKERTVPLKNITSIFKNPFGSRGSNAITIEYKNDLNENCSIKFTANYFSDRLKQLITYTQQKNPHVEIV